LIALFSLSGGERGRPARRQWVRIPYKDTKCDVGQRRSHEPYR